MPSFCKARLSLLAVILVLVNTITCFASSLSNNCVKNACLSDCASWYTFCATLSLVALLRATSTKTGLVKKSSAKRFISFENVAENIKFWRCLGNNARMRFKSGIKPISSILSASSNTKICTWPRLSIFCSTWSSKRPGVATKISIPVFKCGVCVRISTPPNTTRLFKDVCLA